MLVKLHALSSRADLHRRPPVLSPLPPPPPLPPPSYGWGRNAPKLELPDGVGFSVGGGSSIRFIVAQVHYLQPRPKGDHSGVSLT
jgi:hypothetical protein